MEIDELQQTWAKYDNKLNKILKLNEQLLKSLNLEKSKKEMNSPFVYEISSLIIYGILLLFIIIITIQNIERLELLSSGVLTSMIIIFALAGTLKKMKLLTNIDYSNSSILVLQKSLLNFEKLYLKYKKLEFALFPIFFIVCAPIWTKGVHRINILENFEIYSITFIISIVIYYPIMIWSYKQWYSKRIKNVNDFIKEINDFEY